MAGRDSTPDDAVPQKNKSETENDPPDLLEQLVTLDNELHRLLCAYRFYHEAIEATTGQAEPELTTQWHYGLVLVGDWLQNMGQQLLRQVCLAQRAAKRENRG